MRKYISAALAAVVLLPAAAQSAEAHSPIASKLRSIRTCESGGRYFINTGNGFYGAYQFDLQTWRSVGGRGMPHRASKREQDYRAALLLKRRGAAPWPVCGFR